MKSYYTLPEAFIAWKRESLAAHIPSTIRPFCFAANGGMAKLVRDFPALFEQWTVDDWRELELRFWWRFVPGDSVIGWALDVSGRMIDQRQYGTEVNQYGKPWFRESLEECRDAPHILALQKQRMRDAGSNARDFAT